MSTRSTYIAETAFLGLAAMIGASASGSSTTAIVGLPVAAASAAALVYRGRSVVAAVALAFGAAIATALNLPSAVFAVPAIVAVLMSIILLRRAPYQAVGAGLIVLFTAAGYATDALVAALHGRTLAQEIAAQSKLFAAELAQTVDPSRAAQVSKQILDITKQTVTVLPSVYFIAGTLVTVAVLAAIAWAAKRVGEPVTVPSLDRVDLPPLIVLGAVGGLVSLAAARLVPEAAIWTAVGTNLLLCTGALLLVQGLAVYSSFLKRAHVRTPGRVATYVALFIIDALVRVVSLTGLADLWLNFRKLPRESRPEPPIQASHDSDNDDASGV